VVASLFVPVSLRLSRRVSGTVARGLIWSRCVGPFRFSVTGTRPAGANGPSDVSVTFRSFLFEAFFLFAFELP
jgi:hypothetical protein